MNRKIFNLILKNQNNYNNQNNINKIDNNIENNIEKYKNAITVLTRGYRNINNYSKLIKRNKHIEQYLSDKNIPIIIFHEGNITEYQQTEIKKHTISLNIKFISVLGGAFFNDKNKIDVNPQVKQFSLGYKHMCHFWFIDFWKFTENYENILRIDEDCYIEFDPVEIFNMTNNNIAIYGHWENDCDFVTIGLNNFTVNFFKNKEIIIDNMQVAGPYTNLICLNLEILRKNDLLKEYINEIDKSENIYRYRWGDLPLWGEVLKYMYKPTDHTLTKIIKYFHQSHNATIN